MSSDEHTRVLPEMSVATVGTQLSGIYELDELIASGGMGEVYRGHNIQTDDLVAIKIVLPEFARDENILALFKKEGSILNHLSHDAIVRYHVFTVDQRIGRAYLAMEFVNGESLVDIMRGGAMSPDSVRKLGLRIASGLAAAHEAGVIHRDLSPDNIILPGGKVGRAKIIDFGIARSAIVGGETLLGGRFAGKYNYVSPEQLGLFGGDVTERSDIYSLGLVLAAVLRGKPLDMSGSQVEVIEKRRVVPDLSDIAPAFRSLLEAMLQPDPGNRPENMAQVAEWLSSIDSGDAGHALPTQPPNAFRSEPASGVGASAPSSPPGAARQDEREPRPALAAQRAPSLSTTDQAGVAPVTSESPFGPYSAAPEAPPFARGVTPPPLAPALPARKAPKRAGLAALLAAAVLTVVVGGAYYGGLFGLIAPPRETETPATQPDETMLTPKAPDIPTERKPPAEPPEDQERSTDAAGPDKTPADDSVSPGPGEQTPPSDAPVEKPTAEPVEQAPAPDIPEVIDDVARRISWLKTYSGGNCFFVTAVSATDKAIEIEGFGTSVEPFVALQDAFIEAFQFEPQIGVRLIEPEQCVVTELLRALSNSPDSAPELTLGQTVIPSGAEIRGQLERLNGRKTDLILVDHKGIAYSLTSRLKESGDTGTFSINIGMTAADLAQKKSVSQLIIAVSSGDGVQAAKFDTPVPAADLVPRILAEISTKQPDGTAVAKYFRLGG